jgi:predicted phosphoribosyltransferase
VSFADRTQAGRALAGRLEHLRGADVVVLGIPRGGVPVAAEVARALGAELDVVVPRKVGAPRNPELAIGAVAPGVRVLDETLLARLGVDDAYLEREIADQEREIERRTRAYRGDRPPLEVRGRVAIVVDDGVATGSTVVAAARWVRAQGASRTVIAIPVGPTQALVRLRSEADEVVVFATPEPFYAVGQWYARFDQLTDDEVVAILRAAGT